MLLGHLQIRYPDYAFVDFGSGKGGVLLVAAEFPFREVIGVEFAEELHDTAERNIRQYNGTFRCQNVRSLHRDAVQFVFPDAPLALYFFNPFHRVIMEQVLANLLTSLRENPRETYLLYQLPHYPKDLLQSLECAEPFEHTRYFDIYHIAPFVRRGTRAFGAPAHVV
jgi:SAM-dependent methyltransferase